MSKRVLAVILFAASVAALSGCVVVPAYPAYGYEHGYGPPPVVVRPWPYYYYGHGGWRGHRHR